MHRTFAAALLAATSLAATLAAAQPQDTAAAERPMREPMTRIAAEQRAAAMFARLDADGDARLTPADREQRADDRFERLDTNSDGSLSREEFAAAPDRRAERRAEHGTGLRAAAGEQRPRQARMGGRRGGAERIMAGADANRDGTVTQAEFTSAMLARFDAADADRSGAIEAGERRARGRPDRPATR